MIMDKDEQEFRDSKIVLLCSVPTEVDALPIQSLLESYGIKCILQSDVTRSVHPFVVDGLAEVRILILEKDLTKAREVLQDSDFSFS
ncbi:MAG: DUF2007 domain-containing protein [Atribacterota bacterium]|nr:DUF2007 domain-containing protein [Atribacterota bacterium]